MPPHQAITEIMCSNRHGKNAGEFFPKISRLALIFLVVGAAMLHGFSAIAVDASELFTVIGGQDEPVVGEGMPGTEGIQGGFEGGAVVKINGVYHMFPTERAGEPGGHIHHDRVKTRVGHWTSTDAIKWTRRSTILESSGVYALTHEDNPMNDRRSALWSYMPIFSERMNRWYGFYLAYTTDRKVAPNHSFGRIWRCESVVEGIEGIGGPYRDIGIVMEPGLDSQLWEGRQGVASFFPYKVQNGWHAFISGAYPFATWDEYPLKGGATKKAWYVGLARSKTLEGPWTRMGEDINPVTSIHPTFVENPIVSRLPNGVHIAVFDGGPGDMGLPNKMGYTLSRDGLNWSSAEYMDFEPKLKRWWTTMRTPLCLIPEGDDIYTIVFTAWAINPENPKGRQRFNPIGMAKVKLNRDALDAVTKTLPISIPTADQVGARMMPDDIAPFSDVPFEMPQLRRPVFPELTVNIKDRGARLDTPITSILNQAIVEIGEKGGGMVVVPAGKWKSSGRVVLKSNVNLRLEKGSEIEFSGNVEDYLPAVFTRHEGIEVMGPGAFIYANDETNIAVTGEGTIAGPPMDAEIRKRPNGKTVVENDAPFSLPVARRVFDGMEDRDFYRPNTFSPINCRNVLFEGVTIERSTFWNIAPIYCENMIIRGTTVNSIGVPSGDGIDIDSCKNVLIEYCTLDCGDDCFTLKSGRAEDGIHVNKPTENVVIRHCLALRGHGGITIGSETAGGFKNIYAHDCVIKEARYALRFKTRRNRGGWTENIRYERIRIGGATEAFTWDLLGAATFMGDLARRNPPRAVNALTPAIKDIHIKDFVVESAGRFIGLNGIPEIPLANVVIENGQASTKRLINTMNDADGFVLKNIKIKSEANVVNLDNAKNIVFEDITFDVPEKRIVVNTSDSASDFISRGTNIDVEINEHNKK